MTGARHSGPPIKSEDDGSVGSDDDGVGGTSRTIRTHASPAPARERASATAREVFTVSKPANTPALSAFHVSTARNTNVETRRPGRAQRKPPESVLDLFV